MAGYARHLRTAIMIPCLREMMRKRNATINDLAEASGVSRDTIITLRGQGACRRHLGMYVLEALNTKQFTRANQGAR